MASLKPEDYRFLQVDQALEHCEESLGTDNSYIDQDVGANIGYHHPPKLVFEFLNCFLVQTFLVELNVKESWDVYCDLIDDLDFVGEAIFIGLHCEHEA